MKIGLISGHGAGDCGACGCGYAEADLTIEVVKMLEEWFNAYGVETVVYPYERNAFKDCSRGSGLQADFSGCDYVLEIHFNSGRGNEGGDGRVGGTEIYVTPREEQTSVEEMIVRNMEQLGFTNRGIKKNDFLVINKVKNFGISSALLEVCFIDDFDDMDLFEAHKEAVVSAIVSGIYEGFGVDTIIDDVVGETADESESYETTEETTDVTVTYSVKLDDGTILPEVDNLEDYAGIEGRRIVGVAARVDRGYLKYQVHTIVNGWLPYVDGCDWNDYRNGYAGNGQIIDAVRFYYETPEDIIAADGYKKAQYRVSALNSKYYDWQADDETGNGQDGYAGCFGRAIDRMQIMIK